LKDARIDIDLSRQTLRLFDGSRVVREYAVSTAEKGAGEQCGSYCTPRGRHQIRAKIGRGAPPGAVFVARRATGEVWTPELGAQYPTRDWILTRILWLSGLEPGKNRMGDVDTMRRYIYLHGTPDTTRLGVKGSHGCVRLSNRDVIELFDLVEPGTVVDIHE
jgi:L,D-transpeptidase YbiS